jgi:UV DNA damage endonuclease
MYNLCCISNELKEQGIKFQTMTWKRFNQLVDSEGQQFALNELGQRWLNNVEVTRLCIEHCHDNGWGYRVSSSLFPCLTHPAFQFTVEDVPQYEQIMEEFRDIVYYNETWQVRLSTHPDQFNVLASENNLSVDKTIAELNHHGWVMDMLGCERSYYNPINIHINCTKGELSDIAARFMSNLNKCEQSVTSRLVVENEDKGCWTVANLLEHFNIPVTYDNLHDKCNPSQFLPFDGNYFYPMDECAKTWGSVKPLFHYSESHPDKTNPRSHADMPTDCPATDRYDWDIEPKDAAIRELAMIELVRQSEEMGLYETQMSVANKVMEEDREVLKELTSE